MDNRYLFRGKDCNGNWIVGSLIQQAFDGINRHEVGIAPLGCYPIGVDRATVGQCTGLSVVKSYRGNRAEDLLIFDGDKIQTTNSKGNHVVKIVRHIENKVAFCMANDYELKDEDFWDIWQPIGIDWLTEFEAEIIGNIHENANRD